MKINYYLGLDTAKHKVRVALRDGSAERCLLERDLPVSAAGRRELLTLLKDQLPAGASLLVLIEATGVLHLHWAAALAKAGHAVAVINPLMARRLHRVKNALRENKTDPIDARQLGALSSVVIDREVGDWQRFRNRRQVGSYTGLCPANTVAVRSGSKAA